MNAADEWGAEVVRVRLFNTYGPGEYFSEYRSAICKFIYKAMFNAAHHLLEPPAHVDLRDRHLPHTGQYLRQFVPGPSTTSAAKNSTI